MCYPACLHAVNSLVQQFRQPNSQKTPANCEQVIQNDWHPTFKKENYTKKWKKKKKTVKREHKTITDPIHPARLLFQPSPSEEDTINHRSIGLCDTTKISYPKSFHIHKMMHIHPSSSENVCWSNVPAAYSDRYVRLLLLFSSGDGPYWI